MRAALIVAFAAVLSGCASLRVGDTTIYGRTDDVTMDDIQAAIKIFENSRSGRPNPPRAVVIGRNEIRVYFDRVGENCLVVRRIRGRWEGTDYILVTS